MPATGANERPIVIRRIKKVAGGHHGGAWKVAYADFVTAMMAFFMLLWLISNPDKQKLKGLAQYFSPAVAAGQGQPSAAGNMDGNGARAGAGAGQSAASQGQPTPPSATNGNTRGGTAQVPDASLRVMATELRVALDSMSEAQGKQNLQVEQAPDGMRVTLMDTDKQSMFRSDTAELNPFARELLAKVAAKLIKVGSPIAIEGHTDGAGGAQSDRNWNLSGERALAARSALIAAGLTADRISETIAKGASQPVYPDQPNRPENRRITIVLQAGASSLPNDVSFKF